MGSSQQEAGAIALGPAGVTISCGERTEHLLTLIVRYNERPLFQVLTSTNRSTSTAGSGIQCLTRKSDGWTGDKY